MKIFILKITSIFLSLLMLLSTLTFMVDKHYGGDFLVDISFTGEAHSCGMEADDDSSKMKNCCKDELVKIEGQDELKLTSFDDISFKNQQFIIAFHYSYQSLFEEDLTSNFEFKEYPPPDISENFQVAYQTFLI